MLVLYLKWTWNRKQSKCCSLLKRPISASASGLFKWTTKCSVRTEERLKGIGSWKNSETLVRQLPWPDRVFRTRHCGFRSIILPVSVFIAAKTGAHNKLGKLLTRVLLLVLKTLNNLYNRIGSCELVFEKMLQKNHSSTMHSIKSVFNLSGLAFSRIEINPSSCLVRFVEIGLERSKYSQNFATWRPCKRFLNTNQGACGRIWGRDARETMVTNHFDVKLQKTLM